MPDILIPVGLLLLGLLFLGLEFFIPSAGFLGITSGLLLVGGVVSSFYYGGSGVGTTFLVATTVIAGLLISTIVKWWPQTRLGKLILVDPGPPEALVPPSRSKLAGLVGRFGQARSLMLPGGVIDIEGQRYSARASKTIEEGTWVQVTSVQGHELVVKPVDGVPVQPDLADPTDPARHGDMPAAFEDPFEDPLG